MTPPLLVRPLTPELWPALEDLFMDGAVTRPCWCMFWRTGPIRGRGLDEGRRDQFRAIVEDGPPPGLLAFAPDGLSIGWAQLGPRADLPWLCGRRLQKGREGADWVLSCFYVRKGWRRKGVVGRLVAAAIDQARAAGARALEAFPLDPEKTPSASFTGHVSTFRRAGFLEVARPSPPRPMMRLELQGPSRSRASDV